MMILSLSESITSLVKDFFESFGAYWARMNRIRETAVIEHPIHGVAKRTCYEFGKLASEKYRECLDMS
jgi:hypothetical protein